MYIHTCSVLVISTLYPLLQGVKMRTFKILFSCNSSHNFTPKRNELRYHCCLSQLYFMGFITTVFRGALACSCCSRKIEQNLQCRNTSSPRVSGETKIFNHKAVFFSRLIVEISPHIDDCMLVA